MRNLIILTLIVLCFTGCLNNAYHTSFACGHEPGGLFKNIAGEMGFQIISVIPPKDDYPELTATIIRNFLITIKGDLGILKKLEQRYKDYVFYCLKKNYKVKFTEHEISEGLNGFIITYHRERLKGVVRARIYVDKNGYIKLDVFLYEHLYDY
jgi:hypothetical protein